MGGVIAAPAEHAFEHLFIECLGWDRLQSYFLDENFTYKRRHQFVLAWRGKISVMTWQRLCEPVCLQLLARDVIRDLLEVFEISPDRMQIFLRQDRDAGGNRDGD